MLIDLLHQLGFKFTVFCRLVFKSSVSWFWNILLLNFRVSHIFNLWLDCLQAKNGRVTNWLNVQLALLLIVPVPLASVATSSMPINYFYPWIINSRLIARVRWDLVNMADQPRSSTAAVANIYSLSQFGAAGLLLKSQMTPGGCTQQSPNPTADKLFKDAVGWVGDAYPQNARACKSDCGSSRRPGDPGRFRFRRSEQSLSASHFQPVTKS